MVRRTVSQQEVYVLAIFDRGLILGLVMFVMGLVGVVRPGAKGAAVLVRVHN